jgi:hypothetical protein
MNGEVHCANNKYFGNERVFAISSNAWSRADSLDALSPAMDCGLRITSAPHSIATFAIASLSVDT